MRKLFRKLYRYFHHEVSITLHPVEQAAGWEAAANSGFVDALTKMMADDKDRFFKAQTEKEQQMIRGAYLRTKHLRDKLQKLDLTPVPGMGPLPPLGVVFGGQRTGEGGDL